MSNLLKKKSSKNSAKSNILKGLKQSKRPKDYCGSIERKERGEPMPGSLKGDMEDG